LSDAKAAVLHAAQSRASAMVKRIRFFIIHLQKMCEEVAVGQTASIHWRERRSLTILRNVRESF
jgi:hypothetical protein